MDFSSESDCDEVLDLPAPEPEPENGPFNLRHLNLLSAMQALNHETSLLSQFPPLVRERIYLALLSQSPPPSPLTIYYRRHGPIVPGLPALAYTSRGIYLEFIATILSHFEFVVNSNQSRVAVHHLLGNCGLPDARRRVRRLVCQDYGVQMMENVFMIRSLPCLTNLTLRYASINLVKPRYPHLAPRAVPPRVRFLTPLSVEELYDALHVRTIHALDHLQRLQLVVDDHLDMRRSCTKDPVVVACMFEAVVRYNFTTTGNRVLTRTVVIGGRYGRGSVVEIRETAVQGQYELVWFAP